MNLPPQPERLLPLKHFEFEILLSLAGSENHGYAMMLDIESRSIGKTRLHPGTLYRTVSRLLQLQLIAESGDRPDPELDDQRRRYYRITRLGRQVAAAEARRLESRIELARGVGLLEDPNVI